MSDKLIEERQDKERFLDTSVVRSLLLATQIYQNYLNALIGNQQLYISTYIQMEIKRSYLINLISFYFILRFDAINTIGDAISLWSNRFKGSELKAVLQFIPQFFSDYQFHLDNPQNKEKALYLLASYIKRFELLLRTKFKETKDSTACARALVSLNVDLKNPVPGLRKFVSEFGDVKTCRSKCQIEQFLLKQHPSEVDKLVEIAKKLPRNTNTRGFLNIANNLKEILATGATACDCKRCEKIGDAVIALNAPRNMQLEHTDSSFDYLCPPINQPHYKHPSENQVVMNISVTNNDED
ncbi:hypothetical protein WA1_20050 [Scytonema hofmannii PCC 7110]|uniref:Uncharacterized protein n=1 Tax=Scytonema hofmannii PCC 7110 TaxID=128403 RepID=A0A139XC96_9CYAN|nr:hypothetical protein [Scytonema hofmannii]KYC42273.1 hypothetical protein WA1_20050 [Scytonema hofmannii PCC 7110]